MDDPQGVNAAVRNLLNKLVEDFPTYRWESICAYSDGREQTILEITIYSENGARQMGKIAYRLENNEVMHVHFTGYHSPAQDSIIDLLLDIHNIVRQQETMS